MRDRGSARRPDVKIAERAGMVGSAVAVAGTSADIEPVLVYYPGEPATETLLNILEAGPGQRLVTVLEVLSMSNKQAGEGQRPYRRKQRELREARVSLVEIDLPRAGASVLSVPTSSIPRRARTAYQACVRRAWLPERCEVYPLPLRRRLARIRIPLREQDNDIHLDLQAILDLAYRKGRYHLTIDYDEPPDPPLSSADTKWAASLLKKPRRNS